MMSVIFYFYFLLNNVVGAILVVNHMDDHYVINKITNDISRYYGYWAIMYTIIGFPVGQLVANTIFRKKNISSVYYGYISQPLCNEPNNIRNRVKIFAIVLSVISVLATIYTLMVLGGSPLKAVLSGADSTDLAILRGDANRDFGGNGYFRNIFGILLTPILSYVAYGYKKLYETGFNNLWFWGMFVCSILILTFDLEKSPLLWYFIGFVFIKVYLGYQLSNRFLFIVGGIITGLVITMYIVLSSFDLDALFIFNQGIIGRLILSSNAGVFLSFDLFPLRHEFIGFSSFSMFLSDLLGYPYSERASRIIMEYVSPGGIAAGTAGVMNSLFVSEAWANWGVVGLVLSPIYVGFLIQCLYLFFLSARKTPLLFGLFVYFTIKCSINGGINDYIYSATSMVLLLLMYFIYIFGKNIGFRKTTLILK